MSDTDNSFVPEERMTMPSGGGGGGGAAGSIARSIRAMTVGTLQAFNERRDAYEADAIGEVDQQYQFKITGQIDRDAQWLEQDVGFETPFLNGTEDRNVPFLYPHFTYGTVVTKGKNFVITCNVTQWHFDANADPGELVTGAKVEVGVFRPDDKADVMDFAAEIHLNFQGWAGSNAPESDPEGDGGTGGIPDLTDKLPGGA